MNILKTLAAGAVFMAGASSASAAIIYADSVISADTNGTFLSPDRADTSEALGASDNKFYSLGLGGNIVLGFGSLGTGDIGIYEVTFGNIGGYPESVDVFAISGATETYVGSISNSQAQSGAKLTYTGWFDSLKLVDTTPNSSPSVDGFDLDAVSVAAVPLPASALLLAGGIAGFGALRRKKKA